jgi:hypothetical protein
MSISREIFNSGMSTDRQIDKLLVHVRLLKCCSCQNFVWDRLESLRAQGVIRLVSLKDECCVGPEKQREDSEGCLTSWSSVFLSPRFLSGLCNIIRGRSLDILLQVHRTFKLEMWGLECLGSTVQRTRPQGRLILTLIE